MVGVSVQQVIDEVRVEEGNWERIPVKSYSPGQAAEGIPVGIFPVEIIY